MAFSADQILVFFEVLLVTGALLFGFSRLPQQIQAQPQTLTAASFFERQAEDCHNLLRQAVDFGDTLRKEAEQNKTERAEERRRAEDAEKRAAENERKAQDLYQQILRKDIELSFVRQHAKPQDINVSVSNVGAGAEVGQIGMGQGNQQEKRP